MPSRKNYSSNKEKHKEERYEAKEKGQEGKEVKIAQRNQLFVLLKSLLLNVHVIKVLSES